MNRKTLTFAVISVIGFILSYIVSWLFGGYEPLIKTNANAGVLIVFLIGAILPLAAVISTAVYGVIGLAKKDYKRFVISGAVSLITLVLMFLLAFPRLFTK